MRRSSAGLVAVVLAVLFAVLLPGCSAVRPVAVPSPDAGPVEVVQAYVAAINARDRDALKTLSADGVVPEVWLGRRIDLVDVGKPYENAGAGTKYADQDVVGVPIQAVFRRTDGSFPEGEQVDWGYLLVEQGGRWVVFDQGVG